MILGEDGEITTTQLVLMALCGVAFITIVIVSLYLFKSVLSWVLLVIFFIGFGISCGIVIFASAAYYALPNTWLT